MAVNTTDSQTTPPAPSELDSVQLSQSTVALHWEPIAPADEQKLISASYSVFRTGQKLNKEPIRVAYQATKDGGNAPALTSFHDEKAPDASLAFMLGKMSKDNGLPEPVGVFRAVERPSYDELVNGQVAEAIATKGPGDLDKLFNSGDTWTVE